MDRLVSRQKIGSSIAVGDRRLLFVAGTRPEAVKLAPLLIDLAARGERPILVATGQHRAMLDDALASFGLVSDIDLDVMVPGQTPEMVTGRLVPLLAEVMREAAPLRVVVQGDTASTLAGALAARYAGVKVAHVEAGLRSGAHEPHPEEMHRRLVAQLADLHFAPTRAAAAALATEGVAGDVHVTGNSGIDALLLMQKRLATDPVLAAAAAAPLAGISRARPWVLATIHRRENHGAPLRQALAALAALAGDAQIVMPVHPSPAVAGPVRAALAGRPGVHLLPPLPYASFVALMGQAALVLTDSGGVQEEAPALGLPCLVLRGVTERREGLVCGNARLVGGTAAEIVAAVRGLLSTSTELARMARPALPYGCGDAAVRINDILLAALAPQAGSSSPQTPESWWRSAGHRR